MRVGRDHVSATVNTLVLAYVGAALPVLLIFSASDLSAGDVVNLELVAKEIVSTLVGSIGLIAAVPLTTVLAAALALAAPPGPSRKAWRCTRTDGASCRNRRTPRSRPPARPRTGRSSLLCDSPLRDHGRWWA